MPRPDNWTPERVEKLKALWAEGLSCSEIAASLGDEMFTRNAVIGKVHRLNLEGRANPTLGNGKPKVRARPKPERDKRVTLPPLPINGPVLTADTQLLKSEAWQPLPGTTPKRMADLGDIGKKDRPGECRWPVSENPTLFCACETNSTYCAAHARVAYRMPVSESDGRRSNRVKRPNTDFTSRAVQ